MDRFSSSTRRREALVSLGALLCLLGAVDWVTGPDLSPSVFYLVPVGLAAWTSGRRTGAGFALASGVLCLVSNMEWESPVHGAFVSYWNAAATAAVLLTAAVNLAHLRAALTRAHQLASTDHLTGLLNARAFHAAIEREVKRGTRYHHPFTIAYLDLDDFKAVNDRYGHSSGDRLLQIVAETVSKMLRETDFVARLGGDEFALAMPETDYAAAAHVLRLVHRTLRETLLEASWAATCSVGAVTFERVPADVEDVIGAADHVMYAVKRTGKNGLRHVTANRVQDRPA